MAMRYRSNISFKFLFPASKHDILIIQKVENFVNYTVVLLGKFMAKNSAYCDCDVIHEDIVKGIEGKMLPEAEFSYLMDLFHVLSDITRLKMLWALCHNELCVCDIAALLSMTKSAVSHKLKTLRDKNLVDYRKEGCMAFYFIPNDKIIDVFVQISKLFK
jgi:ArsR family transcriptional regulator